MRHHGLVTALAAALLGSACDLPPGELERVEADRDQFVAEAYPVLLADCGFPACHGTPDRFFAVYGPGRTRLDPETGPYDPPTEAEIELSYTRSLSMLAHPGGVRRSPLLSRPLSLSSGGSAHAGDDPWGGPIYRSKQDPGYRALFFWATSAEETAP